MNDFQELTRPSDSETTGKLSIKIEHDLKQLPLFKFDKDGLEKGLEVLFPDRAKELTLVLEDKGIGFGQSLALEPDRIYISQKGFIQFTKRAIKDIFTEESARPQIVKEAIKGGRRLGKFLLEVLEEPFSVYPKGYKPDDVELKQIEKMRQNLLSGGITDRPENEGENEQLVETIIQSVKNLGAETLVHEARHSAQIDEGANRQFFKDFLKYTLPYLGITTAAMITYQIMQASGVLGPDFPTLQSIVENDYVLCTHMAMVLIPSWIIMLRSKRALEKDAYETGFKYASKVVESIKINKQLIADVVSENLPLVNL